MQVPHGGTTPLRLHGARDSSSFGTEEQVESHRASTPVRYTGFNSMAPLSDKRMEAVYVSMGKTQESNGDDIVGPLPDIPDNIPQSSINALIHTPKRESDMPHSTVTQTTDESKVKQPSRGLTGIPDNKAKSSIDTLIPDIETKEDVPSYTAIEQKHVSPGYEAADSLATLDGKYYNDASKKSLTGNTGDEPQHVYQHMRTSQQSLSAGSDSFDSDGGFISLLELETHDSSALVNADVQRWSTAIASAFTSPSVDEPLRLIGVSAECDERCLPDALAMLTGGLPDSAPSPLTAISGCEECVSDAGENLQVAGSLHLSTASWPNIQLPEAQVELLERVVEGVWAEVESNLPKAVIVASSEQLSKCTVLVSPPDHSSTCSSTQIPEFKFKALNESQSLSSFQTDTSCATSLRTLSLPSTPIIPPAPILSSTSDDLRSQPLIHAPPCFLHRTLSCESIPSSSSAASSEVSPGVQSDTAHQTVSTTSVPNFQHPASQLAQPPGPQQQHTELLNSSEPCHITQPISSPVCNNLNAFTLLGTSGADNASTYKDPSCDGEVEGLVTSPTGGTSRHSTSSSCISKIPSVNKKNRPGIPIEEAHGQEGTAVDNAGPMNETQHEGELNDCKLSVLDHEGNVSSGSQVFAKLPLAMRIATKIGSCKLAPDDDEVLANSKQDWLIGTNVDLPTVAFVSDPLYVMEARIKHASGAVLQSHDDTTIIDQTEAIVSDQRPPLCVSSTLTSECLLSIFLFVTSLKIRLCTINWFQKFGKSG